MARLSVSLVDASDEKASFLVNTFEPTELNYAAYNIAVDNVVAALEDIALGAVARISVTSREEFPAYTIPTNQFAQREIAMVFQWVDAEGRRGTFRVPSPDLAKTLATGTDMLDLSDPDVATFVTAVEALARSGEGDTIQIIGGYITGVRA